jgi:hypothetical protein
MSLDETIIKAGSIEEVIKALQRAKAKGAKTVSVDVGLVLHNDEWPEDCDCPLAGSVVVVGCTDDNGDADGFTATIAPEDLTEDNGMSRDNADHYPE